MNRIRLLVVDDHTLFRRGLIALLRQDGRFDVVAEAADVGEAQRHCAALRPDVILLDNHLPGVRGVDGIASLKEIHPVTRILMLTVSEREEDLVAAMRAGADGYLLKTVESEHLCDCIDKVMVGESVLSPEMMTKFVTAFRASAPNATDSRPSPPNPQDAAAATREVVPEDPLDSLSTREREILGLIARGDSNKHIARALDIAETTVKVHVQHIFRKLELTSRVQVAVYAASRGLH